LKELRRIARDWATASVVNEGEANHAKALSALRTRAGEIAPVTDGAGEAWSTRAIDGDALESPKSVEQAR